MELRILLPKIVPSTASFPPLVCSLPCCVLSVCSTILCSSKMISGHLQVKMTLILISPAIPKQSCQLAALLGSLSTCWRLSLFPDRKNPFKCVLQHFSFIYVISVGCNHSAMVCQTGWNLSLSALEGRERYFILTACSDCILITYCTATPGLFSVPDLLSFYLSLYLQNKLLSLIIYLAESQQASPS